ncbi:16S rRNA (guanine(527)-N(7))-methyltransferase RsmG [Falsirhodobacter halotolerans]|uniref:16S rRNA (guanine(527)-N(7))-methyltransferase RsmG n=1 Tax=Falsirhodobacter halotolerans TaxID=1146892 RepID=UPI001FD3F556|nr:16S rRNA (guanine(527)-N(7))-methyltransferase RsmG [Falsirhodobacter halotolerans]MCJ8140807.1 16S rRNA (guanine(527)-N(7))-methyltransferase RsmG [Falsirhodobacter halotolerans]
MAEFTEHARKWNAKINLFSKSTDDDFARRHIEDSVQVFHHAPAFSHWVDLGTGGGFPGVIAAICAKDDDMAGKFTFVESDLRKSAFLIEMIRILDLNARVISQRIEAVAPLNADIVSARALAPLDKLCAFSVRHQRPGGISLYPKGANHAKEIEHARHMWHFDCEIHPSTTNADAVILELRNISRV